MFNTISAKFCLMDNPLGNKIRLARIDKGWSQRELARRIGKSATYIHYLEAGSNPSSAGKEMQIPVAVVDTLAKVLQLNKDELRLTAGLAPESLERDKPQNVQELLDRLNELGIEPIFYGGVENLPDDPELLADILNDFATVIALRLRKRIPHEPTNSALESRR